MCRKDERRAYGERHLLKKRREITLALEGLETMEIEAKLALIDREIAKLNDARRVLADETGTRNWALRPRRVLNAEGRARIAAAQKARWAKVLKAKAK